MDNIEAGDKVALKSSPKKIMTAGKMDGNGVYTCYYWKDLDLISARIYRDALMKVEASQD